MATFGIYDDKPAAYIEAHDFRGAAIKYIEKVTNIDIDRYLLEGGRYIVEVENEEKERKRVEIEAESVIRYHVSKLEAVAD